MVPLPLHEGGQLVILIDVMILSPFLDVIRMSLSTVSFFAQLDIYINKKTVLKFFCILLVEVSV